MKKKSQVKAALAYVATRYSSIPEILRKRKELVATIVPRFTGRTLKGEEFLAMVRCFNAHLAKSQNLETPIRQSIIDLLGTPIQHVALRQACWRLAGNLRRMKKGGYSVPTWTRQKIREWVPTQIVSTALARGGRRGRQFGTELRFHILSGTAAGRTAIQWWSSRKCHFLARDRDEAGNGFAFTRYASRNIGGPDQRFPFNSPKQFATLRCLLLLDPEYSDDDGPGFREIAFSGALTKHNRQQHRRRAKEPGYECPRSYEHPCEKCPIGYRECPAATHAMTYQLHYCPACDEEKKWFDPATKPPMCVECEERTVLESDT